MTIAAESGVSRRLGPAVVPAWCLVMAAAALGPVLLSRGFVLTYDIVFVPHQTWSAATFGLDGGLPRAVPQDAVIAALSWLAPGDTFDLVQKAILFATLAFAGGGAARLLRSSPVWVRMAAATLFLWSAYVAERLVLGQWSLLVAYAVLPWALVAATQVRAGRPTAGARLTLLLALAALTPTGGLLVALVAVPVAVGGAPLRRGVSLLAAAVVVNLPWLVPAVLSGVAGTSGTAATSVFSLRAEGPWGLLLTALGTGGVWNTAVVPDSRTIWFAPLLAVLVTSLAIAGLGSLKRRVGRAATGWLGIAAVLGLVWCLAGAWGPTAPAAAWVVGTVPGGGLLRDAQKWLAPLALLLAIAAPLGARRLAIRLSAATDLTGVVGVALVLLPLVALPDLAWGVSGRLEPVRYPAGWQQTRDALTSSSFPGDVLVLPWSTYRRFPWNADRTVLDPAPRALGRTTVSDGALVVATAGRVVTIPGDDPRANKISTVLRTGGDLCATMSRLGIGWAAVEQGQTARLPADTSCLVPEAAPAGFQLLRLRSAPIPWPGPSVAAVLGVLLANVLALGVGLGCLVRWCFVAIRRLRPIKGSHFLLPDATVR